MSLIEAQQMIRVSHVNVTNCSSRQQCRIHWTKTSSPRNYPFSNNNIITISTLARYVMQFCNQTTKSCEEEEHRTLAGGGTESGEEESAERSLVSSAAAAGLTVVKHGADVC